MSLFAHRLGPSALFGCLLALSACELEGRLDGHRSSTPRSAPAEVPSGAGVGGPETCGVHVERFKELLVVDRSVLRSLEAKNEEPGAALSFRTQLEALAGDPERAYDVTTAWLASFGTITEVGALSAPVTPRPRVEEILLAPWRTAARASASPMAVAPFRLVAVVNRLDLGTTDACAGSAGELRLVYTAVDPLARNALAMTAIVEMPYPATRTAREWAEAWHELGALDFGDAYVRKLAALVRAVTSAGDPFRTRIRTNEAAFEGETPIPWELREFSLARDGGPRRLVPALLAQTPRDGLDRGTALRTWLVENDHLLEAGETPLLPASMQAGASSMPSAYTQWGAGVPISETARKTFSAATCNGCHAGERPDDALRFQHLAPWDAPGAYYGTGTDTRVSSYLHDPGHDDELGRRENHLESLLCSASCAEGPRSEEASSPYAPPAPRACP